MAKTFVPLGSNNYNGPPQLFNGDYTPVDEKIKEIEAQLGEGLVEETFNGMCLVFDKSIPNIVLAKNRTTTIRLHDFLPKRDRENFYSKVSFKIIVFLERLLAEMDSIEIPASTLDRPLVLSVEECYRNIHDIKSGVYWSKYRRADGCILDMKINTSKPRVVRAFHRAIRRVDLRGGIKFDGPRVQVDVCATRFHAYAV